MELGNFLGRLVHLKIVILTDVKEETLFPKERDADGKVLIFKFQKMEFKNFTPHTVDLNDGRSFPSLGSIRIDQTHGPIVDDICHAPLGDLAGLPEPEEGVKLIVSMPVLTAAKAKGIVRDDLVAPATNHPDCIRGDKGFVKSVPCFITL